MATQTAQSTRGGLKATQCKTYIKGTDGRQVRCGHFVSPGTPSCAAGHKNENTLVPVFNPNAQLSGVATLDGTVNSDELSFLLHGSRSSYQSPPESNKKDLTTIPSEDTIDGGINSARAISSRNTAKRAGQVAAATAALGVAALILGL